MNNESVSLMENIYRGEILFQVIKMEQISVFNPDSIRIMDQIYYAAGISVIALGGIGTIILILGILKIKFLKPFKNKYPYEEYKSFEEFASKKPAEADNVPVPKEASTVRMEVKEKLAQYAEQLTWKNAPDEISELSAKEFKSISESNDEVSHDTATGKTLSENVEQTEDLVVD